jgi:hypothetical protein
MALAKKLMYCFLLQGCMQMPLLAQNNVLEKMFVLNSETIIHKDIGYFSCSAGGKLYSHNGEGWFSELFPVLSISGTAGFDVGFKNKWHLNPRMTLQGQYTYFAFRSSVVRLQQEGAIDWRMSAEGGLTLLNFIYVFYGRDFNLDQKEIHTISPNKFTLSVVIPIEYLPYLFD